MKRKHKKILKEIKRYQKEHPYQKKCSFLSWKVWEGDPINFYSDLIDYNAILDQDPIQPDYFRQTTSTGIPGISSNLPHSMSCSSPSAQSVRDMSNALNASYDPILTMSEWMNRCNSSNINAFSGIDYNHERNL